MPDRKRQISGALKVPMFLCWILFALHFIYIVVFHGILKKLINLYDVIIDVYLLFSIEAIAILLTLSNYRNKYNLFIISFIISIVNTIAILFYIFIIVFSFFITNKLDNFINPDNWIKKEDWYIGLRLLLIKLVEILPLLIIIIYKVKLDASVGTINPQSIEKGEIIKNNNRDDDDDDDELE